MICQTEGIICCFVFVPTELIRVVIICIVIINTTDSTGLLTVLDVIVTLQPMWM